MLRIIIEKELFAFGSIAPESLKNDKNFVLPLLSRETTIYKYLSDRLKSDPDIQAVIKNKDIGFW